MTFAPASCSNCAAMEPALPKPCTATVAPFERDMDVLAGALDGVEDAAAGCFVATQRSAQADGFARNHAGNGIALGHAVGVHDPGHGLRIGVNVRRGNVLLRPNHRKNGAGVATRHPFQFALRHVLRVAGDSALGAAERNIHDRAFPRHPRGQRLHLIERDLRVIADAALGGAAHRAVLHAISLEAVNVPVVHADRHCDHEDALGILDHLPGILIEPHCICCCIEVLQGNVVGVPGVTVVSILFPPYLNRVSEQAAFRPRVRRHSFHAVRLLAAPLPATYTPEAATFGKPQMSTRRIEIACCNWRTTDPMAASFTGR